MSQKVSPLTLFWLLLLAAIVYLPVRAVAQGSDTFPGAQVVSFYGYDDCIRLSNDDVSVVLPAHGHPFADLTGRSQAIRQHHVNRLEQVRTVAEQIGRPATVAEFSTHLFSARVQGTMADSETYAHLEHLRRIGEMTRATAPMPYRYVLTG